MRSADFSFVEKVFSPALVQLNEFLHFHGLENHTEASVREREENRFHPFAE